MNYEDYLKRIYQLEYAVEANSFETMCLWREYKQKLNKTWEEDTFGYLVTIGETLPSRPTCVSTKVIKVNDIEILMYEVTSLLVDYRLVDEWFKTNFKNLKHKTDAGNFHNVLNYKG